VTPSTSASEGKETEEGTMMALPNSRLDLVSVADPHEMQNPMPATTKEASEILSTAETSFKTATNVLTTSSSSSASWPPRPSDALVRANLGCSFDNDLLNLQKKGISGDTLTELYSQTKYPTLRTQSATRTQS
jgi:hypothetical protein